MSDSELTPDIIAYVESRIPEWRKMILAGETPDEDDMRKALAYIRQNRFAQATSSKKRAAAPAPDPQKLLDLFKKPDDNA